MRFLLLGATASLAAFALIPTPAVAEYPEAFSAEPGQFDQFAALPNVHRGVAFGFDGHPGQGDFAKVNFNEGRDGWDRDRRGRDGRHRNDRRRHRSGDVSVYSYYDSDGWALYNNRSWQPDSFNDWWHERPERSLPRWLQNNQNCQRLWWSGGGWRC